MRSDWRARRASKRYWRTLPRDVRRLLRAALGLSRQARSTPRAGRRATRRRSLKALA